MRVKVTRRNCVIYRNGVEGTSEGRGTGCHQSYNKKINSKTSLSNTGISERQLIYTGEAVHKIRVLAGTCAGRDVYTRRHGTCDALEGVVGRGRGEW